MYEKLRLKVDELFEESSGVRNINNIKEELLSKLIVKCNNLVAAGKSEDEAVEVVLSGIGNVDNLISGSVLKEKHVFSYEEIQKDRRKTALVLSVSVGLYIISVVILILFSEVLGVDGSLAVSLMLTIDAIATSLIIYHFVSRPKYLKTGTDDSEEWKSANQQTNLILKSVKSILWIIIVAVYLSISFIFQIWAYSWIIFIIGAAVEKIITLTFQLKE